MSLLKASFSFYIHFSCLFEYYDYFVTQVNLFYLNFKFVL